VEGRQHLDWWLAASECLEAVFVYALDRAVDDDAALLDSVGRVEVAVVDEQGVPVAAGEEGKLVIKRPTPGMARSIWGEPDRYKETYWAEYAAQGWYKAGDSARIDEDGYIWVIGRIDDVIKVSGYRLGTAEVESALVSHPAVAESAVVGRPDELKGQGVVCFVTVKEGIKTNRELGEELKKHVRKVIGPVATPDEVRFAAALPKTRSGKIMRRLLKQIAAGEIIKGDTTTLEDINVIAALAASSED
jgi:acetyl-CoA synthetase